MPRNICDSAGFFLRRLFIKKIRKEKPHAVKKMAKHQIQYSRVNFVYLFSHAIATKSNWDFPRNRAKKGCSIYGTQESESTFHTCDSSIKTVNEQFASPQNWNQYATKILMNIFSARYLTMVGFGIWKLLMLQFVKCLLQMYLSNFLYTSSPKGLLALRRLISHRERTNFLWALINCSFLVSKR